MSTSRIIYSCSLIWLVLLAMAACGPAPETVLVEETDVVAGTVVAVEKAATATPEPPPPTETPAPAPSEPPPTEPAPTEPAGPWPDGLLYPLDEEPWTLDIQSADVDQLVVSQCIDGLFEYRGDGSIEPSAATGFEVSGDGRVYTIHLRDSATWSDGEPVVAKHFVDGVMRLLDPDFEAYYPEQIFYDIDGAESYHAGQVSDPATVGVRAVDDHTLEIRLAEPAAYFEVLLASWAFLPVRLDVIEEHGDQWTEAGNYVCNGAYLLDEWVHGDRLGLVKNPNYWDADNVAIERITLPIIDARSEIWDMYVNDELVVYQEGDLRQEAERFLSDPVLSQELHRLPFPGLIYFGLNTLRPPTDDVRVRQALALAVDREALMADTHWDPDRSFASCTIPPNVMAHQPRGACGYAYDPERARELLAEAGYPDGEGFPPLQRWSQHGNWQSDALAYVAGMWEETLGITTEAHLQDWNTYVEYLDECGASPETLAACDLNVFNMGWVMDHGDPRNILEDLFAPVWPGNLSGFQSDRYEELLALAATEVDTAQRAEYYKEADKILVEEQVAVIPISHAPKPALVKPGVTFEYPPFGEPRFKHWALP
jgi:oligopeptide transport system substrate-binding protein